MTRINRSPMYSGELPKLISPKTVEQIIRESGGQQLPPGSVPEDRVAPSTTEGDVQVTEQGKTQWTASENLSGVITARFEAAAAQAASIPKSIGTAKGATIAFSAAGTPVEVPAAPGDGYVKTSDSSQPGGVVWASQAARFKVGFFACPASAGNKAVTGVGFKPGMVRFHVSLAGNTDYITDGYGVMDASGNQQAGGSVYRVSTGAGESDVSSAQCLYVPIETIGGHYVKAVFVSMDSDGFTINMQSVNTAFFIMWEAYR